MNISGVILAGGRAQRMGGSDKGLIMLAGRPMIEYVIDGLKPQVDSICINANRNIEIYRQYNLPVVTDQIGDFFGPLAGIHTALTHAENDLVLTVPCDGPWLPPDLATRLLNHFISQNADVCVAHDGVCIQPVFGLYHQRVKSEIEAFLKRGENGLQRWLRNVRVEMVDFSDNQQAFVNVNTPEERVRVERLLLETGGPWNRLEE